jgi:hypothetical protein
MGKKVEFNRQFQMWYFGVSHGRLLLRSPKANTHRTRVDIVFRGVVHLNLSTVVTDLSVEEADAATASAILRELESAVTPFTFADKLVLLVRGREFEGHVVAEEFAYHEDQEDYGAPSALLADIPTSSLLSDNP